MHLCIDFKFPTLYDKYFVMVRWSLAKLFTIWFIHSHSLLQQDYASGYRMITIPIQYI
jgi:hypothetical protein